MKRSLFVIALSVFSVLSVFSQNATLKGTIKDNSNNQPLEGATVVVLPANGTVTDTAGAFLLSVSPGEITVVISYIGYDPDTQRMRVAPGQTKTLQVKLGDKATELGTVVIGESKYAVKLQKLTGSTDVIKPRMLENNVITNMQQAVVKVPGVTILDGQLSIRGGSGYAYGSGSRTVLVVDDLPLMTPDRGEIKWSFIPIENIEQMELVKGASTLQFGSAALNGVLNVRTAYPRDTPETKFTFYYEGIGKAPADSIQWWKRDGKYFNSPNMAGMSFLHKQKIKDVDVVVSGMLQARQSYLDEEYEYFTRLNTKIKYQPAKFNRLSMGLNNTVMYRKNGFQFYWKSIAEPYRSASGVSIDERFLQILVDPWISYRDKSNSSHRLLTRVFYQRDPVSDDGRPEFTSLYTDYQFRHDFGSLVKLSIGATNNHFWVFDNTLGEHQGDQPALYAMAELNWKWLTINGGLRGEGFRLDREIKFAKPVGRLGANFQIRKYNYIRANWSSAFRFPSIAERFVEYNLSGIRILPNPDIKPESGWTAELGYKRSFQIGKFLGYYDLVTFWQEYQNMIEFTFGTRYEAPPGPGLYPFFQSQNVARARIFGWETSIGGEGKIGPVDINTLIGYTYFYGVDLNDTTVTKNVGDFMGDAFRKFVLPTPSKDDPSESATWDSLTRGMLRYRNRHTLKADVDLVLYNRYHIGTSVQFYGYMTSIDKIFEIFIKDASLARSRNRNKGDVIWDMRAGVDISRNVSFNFLVKNILNRYSAVRFTKPDPPRSFTVQLVVNIGKTGSLKDKYNTPRSGGSSF